MHPGGIDEGELRRLAHLNLIEYCREGTRWGAGGGIEEFDGLLLYAMGTWIPVMSNGVFRLDDDVPAEDVIALADGWFEPRQRGYTVSVRDTGEDDDLQQACEKAGLAPWGDRATPEMVCTQRLSDEPLPAGAVVRFVHTEDDVADFAMVCSAAYGSYGMPRGALRSIFSRPAALLASPHIRTVLIDVDDEPVAGAMTIASHGMAGVHWVGTVETARRMGLGQAAARAATNAGFDLGARAVTLQSSPMGEHLYLRMGYERLFGYLVYVRYETHRD